MSQINYGTYNVILCNVKKDKRDLYVVDRKRYAGYIN